MGRGSGASGARGGGGGGGAKTETTTPKKNLFEKARDGELTASDFSKMDSGSRAVLLGRTPTGTVVTDTNGTQYTNLGNNLWARSGRDIVLGKSAPKTAVTNSYVASRTIKSVKYK